MPVIKTSKGYKCGSSGKEYTGKNAKKKATKQCQAMHVNKKGK